MRRIFVAFFASAAILLGSPCCGQRPDPRGEVSLPAPEYRGVRASAPIPPEQHLGNEFGSDDEGLCVIATGVTNGRWQGVPALRAGKGSLLWRTAKDRPGGYSPPKLERLIREVMPAEKWVSYSGNDPSVLDVLSRRGLPVGATMGTGALYRYRPINHMISLIHYRTDGVACVVDSNDPGVYHWMPAREFARRWVAAGEGWAFAWTRTTAGPGDVPAAPPGPPPLLPASALLLLASAALLPKALPR